MISSSSYSGLPIELSVETQQPAYSDVRTSSKDLGAGFLLGVKTPIVRMFRVVELWQDMSYSKTLFLPASHYSLLK